MSDQHPRPQRLTDLENVVLRDLRHHHQETYPALPLNEPYLASMAQVAVEALTVGSTSGRRRGIKEHKRYPDPGSTPQAIRRLARQIEGSFHMMPNGWVSADEPREHPHE